MGLRSGVRDRGTSRGADHRRDAVGPGLGPFGDDPQAGLGGDGNPFGVVGPAHPAVSLGFRARDCGGGSSLPAFNYPQVPDVKNLENFEKLIYNQFNLL